MQGDGLFHSARVQVLRRVLLRHISTLTHCVPLRASILSKIKTKPALFVPFLASFREIDFCVNPQEVASKGKEKLPLVNYIQG